MNLNLLKVLVKLVTVWVVAHLLVIGKTAGRGQKGQKARSGGGVRPGFEGGQNSIVPSSSKTRFY